MNNIIIVGNGFDLSHGMKTKYTDFISHMVNEYIADKTKYNDLFMFKEHIELNLPGRTVRLKEITSYEDLIGAIATVTENGNKLRAPLFKNQFIESLLYKLSLDNWCDIESFYFDTLCNVGQDNATYNYPEELNEDFQLIKTYLSEYLLNQESTASELSSYAYLFEKLDSKNTLVINFNYTRTIHTHYAKYLTNSTIVDIHGQLEDRSNPIIFGYAALDSEIKNLLFKKDNELFKNIKKPLYKRARMETLLIDFLTKIKERVSKLDDRSIDISILGHSCGISDSHIFNQIFSTQNIEDIYIYYYKDYEEGYSDPHINLGRVVGHHIWEKVINCDDSIYMPQFDDKHTEDKFNAFVDGVLKKQADKRGKQLSEITYGKR